MKECYSCGATEDKTLLYEGIHKKFGLVNVCRKCYFKNKIPLIDKKEINPEDINSRPSVKERLMNLSHVKKEVPAIKKIISKSQDMNLNSIIEKNFKKEVEESSPVPKEMVDNFHWIVMRKRRSLKLTKEQFAQAIKEPLIAVESIEKGRLPKDYKPLIKKVERFLGVKITKTNEGINYNDIINESRVPTGILVSELKKEKRSDEYLDASDLSLDKINEVYGIPKENPQAQKPIQKKETKKDFDEDLSDEDISDLVWGK